MSTLFTGGDFHAGHQAYGFYKALSAAAVAFDDLTDPALETEVSTPMGLMTFPGAQVTNNFQAIETIGSSMDVAQVPGRREVDLNTRIQVADGTFLLNALRDRSNLDGTDAVLGLPLFAAECGIGSDFGASAWAYQYLDCLMNSLRLDYREGQPVSADVQIMAMVELAQASPAALALSDADVLMWTHLSWVVGGIDYRPILSECGLQINNNVQRTGIRNVLMSGATELGISRTCYKQVPLLEKITVNFGMYDRIPAALATANDWGTLTMRAEVPGTGAGRNYFEVAISHNFLNRSNRQQTPANQIMRWTGDNAAYGVVITAGQTT
jgi:hypothetical protein